ncbi:MAG: Mu transposase C-terminal domain-containing protein [Pyrinomonadaceae bacterium]|nr:Mu transposase C-terminal domain-containing protein [Pyrinomonadaceae bacterium]
MSKTLTVNNLIRYLKTSSDKAEIVRIVYLNGNDDAAFVMDLCTNKGFPEFCRASSIVSDLELGNAEIMTEDPWAMSVRDSDLSEAEKELRDRAWNIICDLADPSKEPAIFDKKERNKLFRDVMKEHNVLHRSLYKYMRRFWQRGKVKNALLPDYKNSGAGGQERIAKEVKRGRKRKLQHDPRIGEGVNVDEDMKKVFRLAISKFFRDLKEITLQDVFNLMLAEYFFEEFYFDEANVRKSILISPEKKPTYAQFHYWYKKEKDIEKDITARKGKNKYALTSRPLLGNSTSQVHGPGYRFEIDATVADIYLVSRYNPNWIIGRPVVYIIIDVFSRLIAGFYIGLEGPSWLGASMALANCVADKVEFCAEYGISISDKDWACHHLPYTLLGDGGEIAGANVEPLAANLRVRVETAAVGRGDLKGIVERNFRTIKEKVKPFLPGQVIPDAHKRRGIKYMLDAKLNIHQFTRIIIDGILRHNKQYLKSYDRNEMMIADDVQPIPNELWQWGLENLTGYLNTFPEDTVKLNLMPEDFGRINRNGIVFKKMRYSCERALKEGWFIKGNNRESEKVRIAYDKRKPNYIYLKSQDGRSFEKCYLLPTEEKYMNMDLSEIEYLHQFEDAEGRFDLSRKQQEFADHAAFVRSVVAEAEQDADKFFDPTLTDAGRIAKIPENRRFEKEKRRENEGFELNKNETLPKQAKVIPINSDIQIQKAESLDYPDELDILSQSRKRKKELQKND